MIPVKSVVGIYHEWDPLVYINLFNAKHMYTCDFWLKCLFLWEFFTDMGLEWSQDWIYASILVKNSVLGQTSYVFWRPTG